MFAPHPPALGQVVVVKEGAVEGMEPGAYWFNGSSWRKAVPPKFHHGDVVRHAKTGGLYEITMCPDEGLFLEETREPAYMYKGLNDTALVIRSQEKMEDGRFSIEIHHTQGKLEIV